MKTIKLHDVFVPKLQHLASSISTKSNLYFDNSNVTIYSKSKIQGFLTFKVSNTNLFILDTSCDTFFSNGVIWNAGENLYLLGHISRCYSNI